jgi:hypothetical protein
VDRGMWGVVRREGLLLDGAGEGDLQDRCLGSFRGGDDSVLAPGVLDLLGGWVEEVLVRADLSLGVVEEIGWVGGVVKAGLAMLLPVMLCEVVLEMVEPTVDVKVMGAGLLAVTGAMLRAVLVMGAGLLAVTGAMLRAVLGVQCLKLVMVVDSLVMFATEGEVNRVLSCWERESAGLLVSSWR